MEETTAIQLLSKRRYMRNIIQAEMNTCSPSHPMRKRMDAMTKHRIKRESFIYENTNLKRTYYNNSIKTIQCTYSSPPMSSEHNNRSLTIRTTIPTVTRDQEDASKKLLTLLHIDDFYPQATWIHVYTDGSATDAVQDGGAGSLIYMPNGETLEVASATGKFCTNYDAEVKTLEQGTQTVIDLTDANSENVVFLTDSRSVLDSLVGHAEHNLRRKLYSILEHRRVVLQWIPAHRGIKGNEHADRLAKQGANMEQEKLPITLKQNKTIMKNMLRAKKITDNYHTVDRAGQVTLIRLRTGHNRLNSHMHRKMNLVPSPLCTCGTEDQTTEHILQICPAYQHLRQHNYLVRRNIITPEAVWEEISTREDSWLHSAGWFIRVIKRTRRRRRR